MKLYDALHTILFVAGVCLTYITSSVVRGQGIDQITSIDAQFTQLRSTSPARDSEGVSGRIGLTDDQAEPRVVVVRPGEPLHLVVSREYGTTLITDSEDATGELDYVYANESSGEMFFSPGADRLVADDVRLAAFPGCAITAYELRLGRSANQCSESPIFSCETDDDCPGPMTCIPRKDFGFVAFLALYDDCPSAGGQIIPGTDVEIPFSENADYNVTVDLSAQPVEWPNQLWIGMTFDRDGAGVYVGNPASRGFTADKYDFPIPQFSCRARFGSTADTHIYSGFDARVACAAEPAFEREFPAYLNESPAPDVFYLPPHTSQRQVADDSRLTIKDCRMSSYSFSVSGAVPFEVSSELWLDCDPESVIPGTTATFDAVGDGSLESFEYVFANPILLDSATVYLATSVSSSQAGVHIAQAAEIGYTDNAFGIFNWPGQQDGCEWSLPGQTIGFGARINCRGQLPEGACCRPGFSTGQSPTCSVEKMADCTGADQTWVRGATCTDEPFCPSCGASACCTEGGCVNVTQAQCAAVDGTWEAGAYCGIDGHNCGWLACGNSGAACEASEPGQIGCGITECCNTVCDVDAYCCLVHWDEHCVSVATEYCDLSERTSDQAVPAIVLRDRGADGIASGQFEYDCNANDIPDECEPDCNMNGIADDCELLPMPGSLPYEDMFVCLDPPCFPDSCARQNYAHACCLRHDHDEDGDVDLSDFAVYQNGRD